MNYEVIIYPNLLCTLKIIPGVFQLLLSWVTFFSKYCNDYICVSPSPSLVTSECVNQVSMAWKEARNLLLKSEHIGRQIVATQHRDRSQHDVHHQTVPSNLRSMLRLTTAVHSYRTRSASNQHYYDRRIWNNLIWTAEMKINLCNCVRSLKKKSGLQRGLNSWPTIKTRWSPEFFSGFSRNCINCVHNCSAETNFWVIRRIFF